MSSPRAPSASSSPSCGKDKEERLTASKLSKLAAVTGCGGECYSNFNSEAGRRIDLPRHALADRRSLLRQRAAVARRTVCRAGRDAGRGQDQRHRLRRRRRAGARPHDRVRASGPREPIRRPARPRRRLAARGLPRFRALRIRRRGRDGGYEAITVNRARSPVPAVCSRRRTSTSPCSPAARCSRSPPTMDTDSTSTSRAPAETVFFAL